jgi:acylphosphatase
MMAELASVRVRIFGRVQGVFFRAFACQWATELGLTGYVRNLPNEKIVEVYAEGEIDKLQELVDHVGSGPSAARVARVETSWSEYTGNHFSFRIRY